jgi:uncharacterized beta-barrel protein YwiB (DUF1934 family)
MKSDVMIELSSVIESMGESENIELSTKGKLLALENAIFLSYKETEQSGYDGCTVLIKAEGNDRVTISRSGDANSHLLCEKGKRNLCSYGTPHGALTLGVTCGNIKNSLNQNGFGELSLSYELDVNGGLIGKNKLRIKIRECTN